MPNPIPGVLYQRTHPDPAWYAPGRPTLNAPAPAAGADWTEDAPPWAFTNPAELTARWPAGVKVVDIQTGSSDFYTNLMSTVNAAGGRVVVRLGAGVYRLNQFRLAGTSGLATYAFGFFFPNLQGLIGQGADKTFVQMDANSMSQAQLNELATKTKASFSPNQMGFCRLDGTASSPVLISGLTFRAADQQLITALASDLSDLYRPQPAPHQGLVLYNGAYGIVSHVRFQGAGRALNSQPPFEHACANSQRGNVQWIRCEFDGRRSPALDPARPRRCAPIMLNNEVSSTLEDCWLHHSNVSRYAANDENTGATGSYTLTRTKVEQITNTQNRDPAINGGASLGGYENASLCGWESSNATITLNDCMLVQDNPNSNSQSPMHLQFTSVGNRNPQGGRLRVNGGVYRHSQHPQIDGFLTFRISSATYWWIDGVANTIDVRDSKGGKLAPYVVTTSWPPTASALSAAGVTPATHFLVRTN